MNTLVKPAFLFLLTMFVQIVYPFSSYRLLKNGQGNYVLLLGEIHNHIANPVRTDVETFVKTFLKHELKSPIPCVIELNKEAQSLFVTGKQPKGITVGRTFVQLAEYAHTHRQALNSRLKFFLYDPRELESDIVNSITGMLSREIKALMYNSLPFPNSTEWQINKKKFILTDYAPLSLSMYFTKIQEYCTKARFIKDTLDVESPFLPLFEASLNSLEKALPQVHSLFQSIDSNMRLETAILTLFDKYTSISAQLSWQRYHEVIKLLLDTIDYPYAQIMFLGKLIELLESSRKVVMILSEDHALKLSQFLQSANYKLLREEVIFEELDENWKSAHFATRNGWETDMEKLFSFSARLANELEVFLEKRFPCAVCQKREKTQLCAQCKTTYYCGKECQKAHWPTHKSLCKKPL